MKQKNDIRFILIFIIIVGISLLYLFQASYAKYRRKIEGNMEATVASWNIKVNNESINNKTVLTNDIVPVIDSNTYVKSNVIAPGSTGYFDLIINAEEVDVDFNYDISGSVAEDTPLTDLIITEYEVNGVRTAYNESNKITGTLQKNTGNTSIRIYFKWNDNADTETMNNKDDTDYAIDSTHQLTKIKVTIQFTQRNQ